MMSDAVVISLIAAVAGVLSTMMGLVNNAMARKNEDQNARIESHLQDAKKAVAVIQQQTNGMTERLARVTGEKEFARGQHEGEALVQGAKQAGFDKGFREGHNDAAGK